MESRVLIVEDERDIRDLVLFHLQREGYQVSSASSGEEALRQVRHTRRISCLLDLMLPAMGGLEVCRTLPPGALDGRAAHRDADGQGRRGL